MRILACLKVTPDYEVLRESEWIAGEGDLAEGAGPVTRYVPRVLNLFDESALELALRLRDGLSEQAVDVQLAALTVGGREADPFLTTLLALGYGRAARVDAPWDTDFDPHAVATIVATYAQAIARPDLLLLGAQSGPGDGGTVPFRVAEALAWPCLTQVTEIEPAAEEGSLRVACLADDGTVSLTVRPPCVLAVGNAVVSHLRVPTLADRLARRDASVEVLSVVDLGIDEAAVRAREPARLLGLQAVRRARAGTIVGGETPQAEARRLFDDHLRSALERL